MTTGEPFLVMSLPTTQPAAGLSQPWLQGKEKPRKKRGGGDAFSVLFCASNSPPSVFCTEVGSNGLPAARLLWKVNLFAQRVEVGRQPRFTSSEFTFCKLRLQPVAQNYPDDLRHTLDSVFIT